jgi:hypothetical protein
MLNDSRCCEGRSVYIPSDHDDFTDVIHGLQSIVPSHVEFRAAPDNGESDTWVFAVLPRDAWAELEAADPQALNQLFVSITN